MSQRVCLTDSNPRIYSSYWKVKFCNEADDPPRLRNISFSAAFRRHGGPVASSSDCTNLRDREDVFMTVWKKKPTLIATAGVLAVAAMATACAPPGATSASGNNESFHVLLVVTTSGPLGVYGNGVVHGAQAAANVLNKDGGILGRKVDVTVADMAGEASKGVTLLQQSLTSGTKPDMAFLGLVGSDALAMAPIATQNNLLHFGYTAAASVHQNTKKFPYSFSLVPSTSVLGGMPADAVWADGHKKVVTIASNTQGGSDYVTAFTNRFKELGGEVIDSIKTDPGATDLTPDYQRAYADHPDAIFASVQGQGPASLKAASVAGGTIPLYGDTGLSHDFRSQGITEAQLANVTGMAWPIMLTPPDHRTNAQQTFIAAWQALHPANNESSANAAAGYDALMATAAAATQAGSADAAKMSKALEQLKGDATWAVGFRYTYSPDDHDVLAAKAGSGQNAPNVPFPVITPFVTEDGGYFAYKGSLTAK